MQDKPYQTESQRWEALSSRLPYADGHFYYAVKTTGIYCRPGCPSRAPKRENVMFYDSRAAAEQAGFRPCKRCLAAAAKGSDYGCKVAQACRLLEAAEQAPTLAELAQAAALSKFHFHRIFVQLTGLTPKAYWKAQRAARVRQQLAQGGAVTNAIYAAGYASTGRFYEESTQMLGMKPQHYRDAGCGEVIYFAVGQCSLDAVLVASTVRGICALSLGDDPQLLLQELQDRFANAELRGGDAHYEQLVARVVALIEAPLGAAPEMWNLPLDIRGTAFQTQVWQALQNIPAGSRLSYSELAEQMGCPKAVRAVASACAANKIALIIPCHRVVRSDGSLSGYRWGVERKRELLQRESV